jgi:hypothetical protein
MNSPRHTARLLALVAGTFCLSFFGGGASPYGDTIVSLDPGPYAGGQANLMLGAPHGGGPSQGGTDIYQLGIGGVVVIELASAATDGFGTDLIVYENPFLVFGGDQGESWIEAAFVDVSSDGLTWVRFPTSYAGEQGPFSPFIGVPLTWYSGFAGVSHASAWPVFGADPFDVVAGGGDAFDLADLADDPQVQLGFVNLQNIRFVRITDVQAGVATDTEGNLIWDCGDPNFATADIDAVCAVNNVAQSLPGRPSVEMSLQQVLGKSYLKLELGDPNGLREIMSSVSASWNGLPVDFYKLLEGGGSAAPPTASVNGSNARLKSKAGPGGPPAVTPDAAPLSWADFSQLFQITELDAVHVTLYAGPLSPNRPPTLLRIAVTDPAGSKGGDVIHFP